MFKIYNQSSEDMSDVPDNSVDIVISSPPYNIDTPYDEENRDSRAFEEFKKFLNQVISEVFRVLKPEGLFFNESADTVYSNGKLIALSDLIQKLCLDAGFSLEERYINFLQSEKGIVLTDKEHSWTNDYYSEEDSHSNCHQWLLMKKGPSDFDPNKGKIFYVNYPSSEEGHPCPFSYEHVKIFLEITKFQPGMTVLEPFMGIARLGEEVLKRKGEYIGFELAKKHFATAKARLEKVS
ncbi:MAG: DNA methyltransferase [Candidatus Paceibacterota bacterium]|jgi:site-specific DNA-methyltransferase (adenine-specific)